MEFLHPSAFYLLIFPTILFVYLLLKKENTITNYFDENVLKNITVSNNFINKSLQNFLLIITFLLIIIAIARPVMDEKEHKIKKDLIPIIVAIDVSKSMLANDIYPNRLEFSKQKLLNIIKESNNIAIGVVLFAKSSFILSPITQDFTSLSFLVQNLDSGLNFDNGSNILSMLEASNDLLEDFTSKNIILLSDGGNKNDYSKEISYAIKKKINIYTIAVATTKPTAIPTQDGYLTDNKGKIVTVALNNNISTLAIESGGGYIDFSLKNSDIEKIIDDIKTKSKKEEINSTKIKTYKELFYYPLALALFLLFISFSSNPFKKVNSTLLLILLIFIQPKNLYASILDFQIIKNAKEQYENNKYKESENLYKQIQNNDYAKYNQANALYKQKKYKEAQELYSQLNSEDKELNFSSLHNLGNSFVKQNDLQSAKKAYEDALKIKSDKQTKENLELVNKELENKNKEQEKEEEQNNNQTKKSNNEDKKQSKENQDSKNQDSQKNDSKENKETSENKNSQKIKQEEEISKIEEKKWLDKIQNQKNQTFLRKFESEDNEDENIKNPW